MNILGLVISEQSFVLVMGLVVVFVACVLLAFRTSRTSENVEKVEKVLDVLVGVKISGKSWPVVKKALIEHGVMQPEEAISPAILPTAKNLGNRVNDIVILPELVAEHSTQEQIQILPQDPEMDDYLKWKKEESGLAKVSEPETPSPQQPQQQSPQPQEEEKKKLKVPCPVCHEMMAKNAIKEFHIKVAHPDYYAQMKNGQVAQVVQTVSQAPQTPQSETPSPNPQNPQSGQSSQTNTSQPNAPKSLPPIPESVMRQLPYGVQGAVRKVGPHYGSTCHCSCNHPVVAMCEALHCKCCT